MEKKQTYMKGARKKLKMKQKNSALEETEEGRVLMN